MRHPTFILAQTMLIFLLAACGSPREPASAIAAASVAAAPPVTATPTAAVADLTEAPGITLFAPALAAATLTPIPTSTIAAAGLLPAVAGPTATPPAAGVPTDFWPLNDWLHFVLLPGWLRADNPNGVMIVAEDSQAFLLFQRWLTPAALDSWPARLPDGKAEPDLFELRLGGLTWQGVFIGGPGYRAFHAVAAGQSYGYTLLAYIPASASLLSSWDRIAPTMNSLLLTVTILDQADATAANAADQPATNTRLLNQTNPDAPRNE
jgi:hypothetical protein